MINRRNGPRYQRVLALCVFFFFLTGAVPEGLILRKFCVCCLCFFVLCRFVSGMILCGFVAVVVVDNLWFDDLRAE